MKCPQPFRCSSRTMHSVYTVAFLIVLSKIASKSNLWRGHSTNTQAALYGQSVTLSKVSWQKGCCRCNNAPKRTAGVMHSALLFRWQFAAKLACWLSFCCIVFTGTHAESEIELRLFGMLLYYHSSAFGHLSEMLWKTVRASWRKVWRSWAAVALFCAYQDDFWTG